MGPERRSAHMGAAELNVKARERPGLTGMHLCSNGPSRTKDGQVASPKQWWPLGTEGLGLVWKDQCFS